MSLRHRIGRKSPGISEFTNPREIRRRGDRPKLLSAGKRHSELRGRSTPSVSAKAPIGATSPVASIAMNSSRPVLIDGPPSAREHFASQTRRPRRQGQLVPFSEVPTNLFLDDAGKSTHELLRARFGVLRPSRSHCRVIASISIAAGFYSFAPARHHSARPGPQWRRPEANAGQCSDIIGSRNKESTIGRSPVRAGQRAAVKPGSGRCQRFFSGL